jgi:quinoprotein relay system zinc metallohydrolase 1
MRDGVIGLATFMSVAAWAGDDYHLQPVPVGDSAQVFVGKTEGFARGNGGNIVNTGFIVGTDGVIVIDSGPSRAYGEQQRAAIEKQTALPIRQVFITHAHPDHFLGDQAYSGIAISALPKTISAIRDHGEALSDNLYRLLGGWMLGTRLVPPDHAVQPGTVTVAGRKLRLIAAQGHTDADLMIFDEATRTLFAGDLVFFQRAPTTPNANIEQWLSTLDTIDQLDFQYLVPGHGPIVQNHAAIAQTRDYLRWLSTTLHNAATRGWDIQEVMQTPIPERFRSLSVLDQEFPRSVTHLYPDIELNVLPKQTAAKHE